MITVQQLVTRQKKYMFYLLALFVLGWGFTSYQREFLGLILGTIVSFFSLRLVAFKIDKLLDRVIEGEKVKARPKVVSTYTRLALFGLLILLAIRYENMMEVWSLAVGLLTGYFVMIIDYVYIQYISNREER
ncbi:ATP synthase subunit I [Priestia koreensis]|uniref:ATP synthase subunit I n=1 Tax=Priestia koreensis TaxID=284581 RepID=UPI001F58C314|nr:ATP synthase subunit I [Priestia koreensis]MCM3004672.1 ATP synthase subunit I [Priestia koreensis]UNL84878.1 ATP synthase subunit I [Priestia koreensis]